MRGMAYAVEDFLARAKAAIDQPALAKGVYSGGIVCKMVRLTPHRLFPVKAQPAQVLIDAVLIFGAAAGGVDVLDAQDETACGVFGGLIGRQRREGVPLVQASGRRGRKAGDEGAVHGQRLMAPPAPVDKTGRDCQHPWRMTVERRVRMSKAEALSAVMGQAREDLVRADPVLARVHAQTPALEWRLRPGGYEGLFRMIVEQQVSVAAAAAIWKRVCEGLGEVTPQAVLARDIEALRSLGLSGQKARYGHEIARAHIDGLIDFDHLERLSDDEAIAALTAIKGVGRWTAETFLMFCEGRVDVFPAGDVALQEAWRWAAGEDTRLKEKAFYARADLWRPWRSVAAQMLWGWYGAVKRGDIALED